MEPTQTVVPPSGLKRSATETTTTTVVKKAKVPVKKGSSRRRGSTKLPKFGFPTLLKLRHRYVDQISFSSTAGSLNVKTFSCNSLYDPDIAGAGHQPMYFDNLMAIYDHYTVIASRITVKFVLTTTSATSPSYLALHVDDDATGPSTFVACCEQSTSVSKIIPQGSSDVHYLKSSWNARKYFGGDALSNDNLQGTASASPTEQSVYHVTFQTGAAGAVTGSAIVEIEYLVVYDELKTQDVN